MLIKKKLLLSMIGPMSAGKTTFMHSVYHRFQALVSGFTLRTSDPHEHRAILSLGDAIQNGRYPVPTAQRALYGFTLLHGQKEICEFDWADHRGDVILGSGKDQQTTQLRRDLRGADGIVLFCDSPALQKGREDLVRLDRLCTMLGRALLDSETGKAVLILFTKSDLARDFEEYQLEAMEGFLEAIAVSKHSTGALIPVACGINAHNLHLPLLFLISTIVLREAQGAAADADNELAKVKHWNSRYDQRWPFGTFSDWLQSVPSDKQMAEWARIKAQRADTLCKQLEAVADLMIIKQNSVCIVSSDKKVTDYCVCLSKQRKKHMSSVWHE